MTFEYVSETDPFEVFVTPLTTSRLYVIFKDFVNGLRYQQMTVNNMNFWWVHTKVDMCHQECVWRYCSWMTTKNNKLSVSVFLAESLWGHERPVQSRLHVVLHTLWNHGENLSESFVIPLFVRSTVCSSVLVLKMRCSAVAVAHKSWTSWLCSRNPSSPPHCEAHCEWSEICSGVGAKSRFAPPSKDRTNKLVNSAILKICWDPKRNG